MFHEKWTVKIVGSARCSYDDGTSYSCNLHGVWDTALIAHRQLSDEQYVVRLRRLIKQGGWDRRATGSPTEWAMESHGLAKVALLPPGGVVDEDYYQAQIPVIDERLGLGGLRLAAWLNRSLADPLPAP
jgi:hypothetical protein